MNPKLEFTVDSAHDFDTTVTRLQEAAVAEGFSVLAVHELSKIMAGKGFERDRITVVEVCNAKQAHTVLADDIRIALHMPCPISVYVENSNVKVSSLSVADIGKFYAGETLARVVDEVDVSMRNIVRAVAADPTSV
jgi:uncharacterized protein (DUF302 family)